MNTDETRIRRSVGEVLPEDRARLEGFRDYVGAPLPPIAISGPRPGVAMLRDEDLRFDVGRQSHGGDFLPRHVYAYWHFPVLILVRPQAQDRQTLVQTWIAEIEAELISRKGLTQHIVPDFRTVPGPGECLSFPGPFESSPSQTESLTYSGPGPGVEAARSADPIPSWPAGSGDGARRVADGAPSCSRQEPRTDSGWAERVRAGVAVAPRR